MAMPAMNAAITALDTLKQNDITIVGVSRQSTTDNCELRTCPRFLHGG